MARKFELRKSLRNRYTSKRCPACSTDLPLEAAVCIYCKSKVGKVGEYGMAQKPIAWMDYLICLLAWAVFGVYMWWAFF